MSASSKKVFIAESFSETISMAESLGWLDLYTDEEWSADAADACEDEAIEFIESKGFKVLYPGECE